MSKEIKDSNFFTREAKAVACDLLGKFICSRHDNVETKYQIIETEAYYHDETDYDGKLICYGANKTKSEAKRFVCAPLFAQPGTLCVYCGQLLLSVTNDEHPDNVLIKSIKDAQGKIYKPHGIAETLNLYKSKENYCNCHGQHSLDNNSHLYLKDGRTVSSFSCSKRVNIKNDQKYKFRIDGE